jgi:hypothetical protein
MTSHNARPSRRSKRLSPSRRFLTGLAITLSILFLPLVSEHFDIPGLEKYPWAEEVIVRVVERRLRRSRLAV